MAESFPHDLVFMDCQMPGVDGYAAAAEIRRRHGQPATGAGRRPPIIAMTAPAANGERERCLAAGMDDLITRPLQPSDVQAILERWLAPPAVPARLCRVPK